MIKNLFKHLSDVSELQKTNFFYGSLVGFLSVLLMGFYGIIFTLFFAIIKEMFYIIEEDLNMKGVSYKSTIPNAIWTVIPSVLFFIIYLVDSYLLHIFA